MHDPKFEKEVQQKLEELSFSPSDAVWTRVEQAVNGKKRRRVPVFWLFLLPALLMTGAGVIYFSRTSKLPATSPTATPPASSSNVSSLPAAAPAVSARINPARSTSNQGTTSTQGSTFTQAYTHRASSIPSSGVAGIRLSHARRAAPSATSGGTPAGESTGEDVMTGHSVAGPVTSAAATKAVAGRISLPGLNTFDRHFSAPAARSLPSAGKAFTAASAPVRLKPKYSWEAGFAGGIGLSSQNKTLFQQPPAVASLDLRANAAPISGQPKSYTSHVQPGLSYWAGIVVQRPLRKNLALSLGLDLHYYSSKIQIGQRVDNFPSANYSAQSLFTAPSQVAAAAYPYYSVGDNDVFINRYYYLELPASVVWQFNHSRSLPLFWEGGFSLSYLVSSNALYFNSKSGVFYKDGSVTNKTQFNLATALLVGLPIRGIRLQAGPQVQYGLTSLQKQGSGTQHLFYGGLRLVLLPGKAK